MKYLNSVNYKIHEITKYRKLKKYSKSQNVGNHKIEEITKRS